MREDLIRQLAARRIECPLCIGNSHTALWWSKAGMTYKLCEPHKAEARAQRRVSRRLAEHPPDRRQSPSEPL